MAKHRDRLPGGLADKNKPSDFDKKELRMGTGVEREHVGKKKALAREIAMDHLKEFPKYYTALKKMEKGLEKSKNEAAMDIGFVIGLLEGVRGALEEATCSNCHGELKSPPSYHISDWKQHHATVLKVPVISSKHGWKCTACHDKNDCESCHAKETSTN